MACSVDVHIDEAGRRKITKGRLAAILMAACVLVAVFGVSWLQCRKTTPKPDAAVTGPHQSATATNSTTRSTAFPEKFCEHQTASVRGTAAYVVTLRGDSKIEAIKAVRACGARVIGPMPPNALLVETSIFALGKMSVDGHFASAAEWLPQDKIEDSLRKRLKTCADNLDVSVVALSPADIESIVRRAAELGGTRVEQALNGKSSVTLRLPCAAIEKLATVADVRWIEPFSRPTPLNDKAVGPTAMNVMEVWETHGLTGKGQVISTSDTGIDNGDLQTMHEDLRNQICLYQVLPSCYADDRSGHGTHTAGSLVGNGAKSQKVVRGVAYEAKLCVWACNCTTNTSLAMPNTCEELFRPDTTNHIAFIHSGSWGEEKCRGAYNVHCHFIDEYVWKHPDFLPVFAVGNENKASQTVAAPASAKNVLAVGSTENARQGHAGDCGNGDPSQLAGHSSCGPCADGRIKPDVCAPGSGILSTYPYHRPPTSYVGEICTNDCYGYKCGTSMSTALAAGAAALVRQWLIERRGFTNDVPTAALVKAVLTGGARGGNIANNSFGWGRIDLGETLYPSNRTVKLFDRIPFTNDSVSVFDITLTNDAPFEAQLVWIDYPGTVEADRTLVNDLDLVISNRTTGAIIAYGNGVTGGDRTNNVESVRIESLSAGNYAILVRGANVAYDSTQGGAAALYLRGAFGETEPDDEPEEFGFDSLYPTETNLVVKVGSSTAFSAPTHVSTNRTVTYTWTVDGVTMADASENSFEYKPCWGDRGLRTLTVTAVAERTGKAKLTCSNSWQIAAWGEVFVNGQQPSTGATSTGEESYPFQTLTEAIRAAVPHDVIRVGAGTYAEGIVATNGIARIEAIDGPEMTIIDGQGKSRCYDGSASTQTVLSGFTLTNGWINSGGGAGACCGILTNCNIRNCHAIDSSNGGGGAYDATLTDCRIENCSDNSYAGGVYKCTATFCHIVGNCATNTSSASCGGAADSVLTHCTIVDNTAKYEPAGVGGGCVCTNCIVWHNTLTTGGLSNWRDFYNQPTAFCCSCTVPTPTNFGDRGGNTTSAPLWIDADAHDFRLKANSPCLGTASDGGNMGAWQGKGMSNAVLTVETIGPPGSIEPMTATVEPGGSARFTISSAHPLIGLATNGVPVQPTQQFEWKHVESDGVLTATFGTTNFYVDAEHGDDRSNGWSAATAKRTIQAAVDVAATDETVWVAPGTYTGTVASTASRIDIIGINGPKETRLSGSDTNRCYNGKTNTQTRLVGFTLENGRSDYGGGASSATLSNCVIRNCKANYSGGGVYNSALFNCVITQCSAGTAGGASNSTLFNCTVRGNKANSHNVGGIDHFCTCTNSIIWDNVRSRGETCNWEASTRNDLPQLAWCCTTPINALFEQCFADDPKFATEDEDGDDCDMQLYETSPCLGAGYQGLNIGSYSGKGVFFPIPSLKADPTSNDVADAISAVGYKDESVARGIGTNVATYRAFQAWATNGFSSRSIVLSSRAFDSFLIRDLVETPTLLGEGNQTKVTLSDLTPSPDGTCSVTVSLTDGDNAVPLKAAKEAFAARTRVGSDLTALQPAEAENVRAEPAGASVKLILTTPPTTSYFMRFDVK